MKARKVMLWGLSAITFAVALATSAERPTRPAGNGQEWLSWSQAEREVFADAYLTGYLVGKMDACQTADKLFELDKSVQNPQESAGARCLRHARAYTKSLNDYTTVITEFYRRYPKFRSIPDTYLISQLTDEKFQSADGLHQLALDGKIRTDFP